MQRICKCMQSKLLFLDGDELKSRDTPLPVRASNDKTRIRVFIEGINNGAGQSNLINSVLKLGYFCKISGGLLVREYTTMARHLLYTALPGKIYF